MLTEGVDSTKEAGLLSDGRQIFNFTSHLHLHNLQESDVGNFQCIITNKFGSAYTHKANITIHGQSHTCKVLMSEQSLDFNNEGDELYYNFVFFTAWLFEFVPFWCLCFINLKILNIRMNNIQSAGIIF